MQTTLIFWCLLATWWAGFARVPSGSLQQPPAVADSFHFSTHSLSNYHPTLLGNGYLSVATPGNGASPAEASLTGLYDYLEENAYPYQALIPS